MSNVIIPGSFSLLVITKRPDFFQPVLSTLDAHADIQFIENPEESLAKSRERSFNAILLDLGKNPLDHLLNLRNVMPDSGIIAFLQNYSREDPGMLLEAGAYEVLNNATLKDSLKLSLQRLLEKQNLILHNRELIKRLAKEKTTHGMILNIYKKMARLLKIDLLANFVTASVFQIVGAQKASMMLVDENTGNLTLAGSFGVNAPVDFQLKMGSNSVVGWVVEKGELLLVNDVDGDPRFKNPAKGRYKTNAFICLPLKVDERVIGVMNITDKVGSIKTFSDDDVRYLLLLASLTLSQIENIKLYEKLSSLAVTDALTGLNNHRQFQERLQIELERCSRYDNPLSLAMFDIDFFKSCNDRFGHQSGDDVLKLVSSKIKDAIRNTDLACRYGGEEFMVIMPDTPLHKANICAERIRKDIENCSLKKSGGGNIKVTVSAGLAQWSKGQSRDQYISAVDRALYKAKKGGRNRVFIST